MVLCLGKAFQDAGLPSPRAGPFDPGALTEQCAALQLCEGFRRYRPIPAMGRLPVFGHFRHFRQRALVSKERPTYEMLGDCRIPAIPAISATPFSTSPSPSQQDRSATLPANGMEPRACIFASKNFGQLVLGANVRRLAEGGTGCPSMLLSTP
jgi:hypothetical protein